MSFFKSTSNISTRELAEKCERQEVQLKKTQTRLGNLVAAFKALQEEKKTLEETLASLAPASSDEATDTDGHDHEHSETDGQSEKSSEADPGDNGVVVETKQHDDTRLSKLTSSLATMSAERAKMQTTFQNDRKKMKNEYDSELLKVTSERDRLGIERGQFEAELKELKNFMKEQVRVMETENTASKIANRELQKQLNAERKKVDVLDSDLRDTSSNLLHAEKKLDQKIEIEKENKTGKRTEELQHRITTLQSKLQVKSNENKHLSEKISAAQIEVEQRINTLNVKNEEISNLLKAETKDKELKMATLEDKIADLTNLCAQLEKDKQNELQKTVNQKELTDQLRTQIDLKGETTKQDNHDYFSLFVQAQDDLKQMTIELEETKATLALATAESNSPQPEPIIDETITYKEEIKSLKASLVIARRTIEQLTLEKHNINELHHDEISKIKLSSQEQNHACENRADEKISEYESQIANMRERSQKILQDKDNEIELMRKEQVDQQPIENDSISQLFQNGDHNLDTALILYSEQLARKDVEIHSHRARRKELEDRIRSLQDKLVEEKTETADLRDKIQAEERDSSPASKEYLRNLVMQFLAVPDGSRKKAMLSAIETILEFSKEDVKQLKKNWKR